MSTNDNSTADVYESSKNKRAVEETLEAAALGDRGVRAVVRGRNRVLFAAIPGVAGAGGGGGGGGDASVAQALARSGHPAGTVESVSGVSASVAQMNERRFTTTK